MAEAGNTFVTANKVISAGSRRAHPAARSIRARTAAKRSARPAANSRTPQYATAEPLVDSIGFVVFCYLVVIVSYGILRHHALSDFDQRHRFVANGVWMPASGDSFGKAARLLLNGWAGRLTF
jgi:hypothetical protein